MGQGKFFVILFFVCLSHSVFAENFFELAAQEYGVRPDLLYCISKIESKSNIYAIRADFKKKIHRELRSLSVKFQYSRIKKNGRYYYRYSIFPSTLTQFESILKRILLRAVDYDIGLMQINKYWIQAYNLDPVKLTNPRINIFWAAYILADCTQRAQNIWQGVQCYNTGKIQRLNRKKNNYPFLVYEACKKVYNGG